MECSFCLKDSDAAKKLITGEEVAICDECSLGAARAVLEGGSFNWTLLDASLDAKCNFCGASSSTTWRLVSNNEHKTICDRCLGLCCEILEDADLCRQISSTRPARFRIGFIKKLFPLKR